jgi:hypothetical protein
MPEVVPQQLAAPSSPGVDGQPVLLYFPIYQNNTRKEKNIHFYTIFHLQKLKL